MMYSREFTGINSFLVGMARLLLEEGVERSTRGYKCMELDQPIIIKITDPRARLITLKERKWNCVLPYAESLWIATGRNDMSMIGSYLKKMYDFSDDNISMRAAYGPRLRYFRGVANDYENKFNSKSSGESVITVDQFSFIEKIFQKDPFTRQAVISITDPAKDFFSEQNQLKKTKDFPCTNNLQFIKRKNSLDLVTHMRSNDLFWGASAVNIFNFTFIQEYFASILGLEVGNYYHIVNNLHYYEDFQDKVNLIANIADFKDEGYVYKRTVDSLNVFDKNLLILEELEEHWRTKKDTVLTHFEDEFFDDWAKVLYSFHNKTLPVTFSNPLLNELCK
ncbi:MAG: thymidylate synthase [Chitinophagaceae bacterium]